MSEMNIEAPHSCSVFSRLVTSATLFVYCTVMLSPSVQAASPMPPVAPEVVPSPPELQTEVARTHPERVERMKLQLGAVLDRRVTDVEVAAQKAELRALISEILDLEGQELAQFAAIEKEIADRNLPAIAMERHREALAEFKRRSAAAREGLARIEAADSADALRERATELSREFGHVSTKRRHEKFEPSKLPFRSQDKGTREPKTEADQFMALFTPEPLKNVQIASTLPLSIAAQVTAPGPEYLSPSTEVQITPAIEALAEELNRNPIEIYSWVRNNIHYIPTHGGIQGSEMTLETKQGNAFDIASLLIALLRAAGVPARYAYGTVEIPIAQVMNWIGGITSPNAALDHLAQGGIPVSGVSQGGIVKYARMEHVWVEAFVDFIPSRGAKNRVPDSWVPLDASFKQYQAIPALITPEVSTGIQQVARQYLESATPGTAGALTQLDTELLKQPIAELQAQIAEVLGQNTDRFMLEEFIGGREIIPVTSPTLAASLPYRVIARGPTWAELPSSLRVAARVELLTSGPYGEEGARLLTSTIPLATLGYGSLHLSHVPATAEDASIWQSYADAREFPPYLIRARARLTLDGQVLAESGAMPLGDDLVLRVTFLGASGGAVKTVNFSVVSGDEIQIGINGGGLIPDQGLALRQRTDLGTAEGNLYVANKVFWTQADFQQRLLAHLNGAVVARLPSVGIFASPITVIYSFGVPRRAHYSSRQVDVKLAQMSATSLDGDGANTRALVMQTGMTLSSLEGSALEHVFAKPIGHGSNTMRMLELANRAGMPIYHVTSANLQQVRGLLQHAPEVMADVSSAVAAGLEVVIPQRSQENEGWRGSGYIMMDPLTGSADYRVSGGLSGNFAPECETQTQPVRVTVPDISFIWWMLFGYLVDEDYNFNGVGLAAAIAQVVLVTALIAIVAPAAGALLVAGARAAAPLARATFVAMLAAFSGLAAAEEADPCDCTPQPMNRRKGGTSPFTARHNACADLFTDFPGVDVELAGIAYDGWRVEEDRLYEIKTGSFYSVIRAIAQTRPSARKFLDVLLGKAIYDFYRERVPSGLCGIEFGFGVSDSGLLIDMQDFFRNAAGNPLDAARVFPNGC